MDRREACGLADTHRSEQTKPLRSQHSLQNWQTWYQKFCIDEVVFDYTFVTSCIYVARRPDPEMYFDTDIALSLCSTCPQYYRTW